MSTIQVSILMGSHSDWAIMQHAAQILDSFAVPHEARALSAHRTPDALFHYLNSAEERGCEVFIAGAGAAAHLPGVIAAKTLLPVLGVPLPSSTFVNGLDALLSIVQMPAGVPVATLAVGKAGAVNAALLAVSILSAKFPEYKPALARYRVDLATAAIDQSVLKN